MQAHTYLNDRFLAPVWNPLQIDTTSFLSSSSISTFSKNLSATLSNASSGQAYKQQTNT